MRFPWVRSLRRVLTVLCHLFQLISRPTNPLQLVGTKLNSRAVDVEGSLQLATCNLQLAARNGFFGLIFCSLDCLLNIPTKGMCPPAHGMQFVVATVGGRDSNEQQL